MSMGAVFAEIVGVFGSVLELFTEPPLIYVVAAAIAGMLIMAVASLFGR